VKVFFVMVLLSVAMFMFIVSLDLIMHFPLSGIIEKELDPFRVTEGIEMIFFSIFALYFAIKAIYEFVKKKQNSNSS